MVVEDFPGLLTNIDVRDLTPGAMEEQVNICSVTPGMLTVREGIQEVIFEA